MQRRVEMLVPNKRRATRQQRANTKEPTTEEMQIMSKNVCHYRKLTPVVLRKLGTPGNPPHITRKIKRQPPPVDWLGSFFQDRNYTKTTSSYTQQNNTEARTSEYFWIIHNYKRMRSLIFFFHYQIIEARDFFPRYRMFFFPCKKYK